MKTYQRLLIFGLAALAFTALLSPWAAAAWEQFISGRAGWEEFHYPFSRIFDRFFMISGIILFFVFRPLLEIGPVARLGLAPRTHAARDLALGAGLALASMAGLVVVMSLTGVFTPFFRLALSESLSRCGEALLAAVGAGLVEEIFFRGIIFKGLRDDLGPFRGYLFAGLLFSAIHFVQPASDAVLREMDAWAGVRHVVHSFHPFLTPTTLLPGLFGLFLIGVILSYAFARTGTLYLSIGLHGGWIFSLKTMRVFGDFRRADLGWVFGSTDPKIVSGVVTWVGLLLVALAVHWFTRNRSRLTAPSSRPEAAVTYRRNAAFD
jgi:membrane protease YdiL (CAAX protease family)